MATRQASCCAGPRDLAVMNAAPHRRFLVFFRAGNNSLHRAAIEEDPERNWDCCVSWYVDAPAENVAEYYASSGFNKFEGLDDFLLSLPDEHPYSHILALDDDIKFSTGDISRFFDICARHELYLAQPALQWGTNANHDVTLWNPVCKVRQSRFVEVMAPCFSKAAIAQLQPTFRLNKSTWGIDYAWASILRDKNRIAIVDAIKVEHTRPVSLSNGPFYEKLRAMGADPELEYRMIKGSYPSFGGLSTKSTGHYPTFPCPHWLVNGLTKLLERIKKRIHRKLLARRMR
jgi:hypothetical protein